MWCVSLQCTLDIDFGKGASYIAATFPVLKNYATKCYIRFCKASSILKLLEIIINTKV